MFNEGGEGSLPPEAAKEAERMEMDRLFAELALPGPEEGEEGAVEFQAAKARALEALKNGDFEAMGIFQEKLEEEANKIPDASGQIRAIISTARIYNEAGLPGPAAEALEDAIMYAENVGYDKTADIEKLLKKVTPTSPDSA